MAGLFDSLFSRLFDQIKKALGPFGKLFDLISNFWKKLTSSYTNTKNLVELVIGEVRAWKSFKEAIPFRTGVISLPGALSKTQELIQQIIDAWHAIVDLVEQIKQQVGGGLDESPVTEAEDALKAIEEGGFHDILAKFPKLGKSLEKIFGFIALAIQILEAWLSAVDDLTTIVNVIKGLREEVETGSTIFLSQKNKRKVLRLEDGGSIKIRVGNLH